MRSVANNEKNSERIKKWMESQGINYDLRSEDAIRADVDAARDFLLEVAQDDGNYRRYPAMPHVCMLLWRASVTLGFRRGIEQGWAAVGIGEYFTKYPERKCIAERIREKPDASDKDLCKHLDSQEARLNAANPNHKEPWYPPPWERRKRRNGKVARQSDCLWETALNDPKLSNRLHKFLSSQRKIAKSAAAQWYWAWCEFKKGKSIQPTLPFSGYSFLDIKTGQFLDPSSCPNASPMTPEKLDDLF
jgi:hypothetical protein